MLCKCEGCIGSVLPAVYHSDNKLGYTPNQILASTASDLDGKSVDFAFGPMVPFSSHNSLTCLSYFFCAFAFASHDF